jgi:hypothetical protein
MRAFLASHSRYGIVWWTFISCTAQPLNSLSLPADSKKHGSATPRGQVGGVDASGACKEIPQCQGVMWNLK